MIRLLALVLVVSSSAPTARAQSLLVSSQASALPGAAEGILRFNPATGGFETIFEEGTSAVGLAFGPSGDLYAADFEGQAVYQLNGITGQVRAVISGSEVSRPVGVTCGPDANIYVSDSQLNRVVRYNGVTGAFIGVFASGGLSGPWHLVFGPDGDLYVTSSANGRVLRYDGTTGAAKGIFASNAAVTSVFGIAFSPSGDLFVTASRNDPVFRFNGTTGAFIGVFTSGRQLTNADDLLFGPDGDLYVANYDHREVARFDGTTGVFKSAAVNSNLGHPTGMELTPQAKVLNVSTRLQVQTGDNVLIGGFIITGTKPKKVIVRAIGPSLGGQGVAGALADPRLELHDSSSTIATNDNWRVTQQGGVISADQQAAIQATGVPPSNDLESAIIATLPPGAYTAVVQGVNGGTGVGLVEAFDLNQATPAKLANISTRGFVSTGDDVMIGGFIVRPGGGTDARVIVRALGPSLRPGISNALDDPTVELRNSNGGLVAFNNNWRDAQETEIQATTVAPSNDAESAIVANLGPDAYTAIVRGNNATTGVGLVEVFSLD